MTPQNRAARIVAVFALVPAVLAGALAGGLGGLIPGIVVFVVVAAALAGWARFGGDAEVRRALGGRPADPRRDARLCNLVEGLSIGAGVRLPEIRVIESAGLNAIAAAARPERALVAVTTGLLRNLDRIELEGVLAEELVQLRRHETLPATVVAATFGFGRRWATRPEQDALADQAAVSLTRYPPGLVAALEKVEAAGSAVPGAPRRLTGLWLADPAPRAAGPDASEGAPGRGGLEGATRAEGHEGPADTAAGADPERLPLRERIEALREL